jgi:hypothetical protein
MEISSYGEAYWYACQKAAVPADHKVPWASFETQPVESQCPAALKAEKSVLAAYTTQRPQSSGPRRAQNRAGYATLPGAR